MLAIPDEWFAHGCGSRIACVVVIAGHRRIVRSAQPAASGTRPRARGAALPERTRRTSPARSTRVLLLRPEAEAVLGRAIRRCWPNRPDLCDSYNRQATDPSQRTDRRAPRRRGAPIAVAHLVPTHDRGPRPLRRRSTWLLLSPRSERARAGRGTTALTLAPARAGLLQRHGLSCLAAAGGRLLQPGDAEAEPLEAGAVRRAIASRRLCSPPAERSSRLGRPRCRVARNAIVSQQRAGSAFALEPRPTRRFCFHVSIAGGHPSGGIAPRRSATVGIATTAPSCCGEHVSARRPSGGASAFTAVGYPSNSG